MSYCVNCGVKLADSEKKCPLCFTEVYNPSAKPEDSGKKLYPEYYENIPIGRKTKVGLISIIFAIPAFVTFVCDISISGKITWSAFVNVSLLLAYLFVVMPVIFPKKRSIFLTFTYGFCTVLYLGLIEILTKGDWLRSFAAPLVAIICLFSITVILIRRRTHISTMGIIAIVAFFIGLFCICLELLLISSFKISSHMQWSFYPFIALFGVSLILALINNNKPLKTKLEKKMFL